MRFAGLVIAFFFIVSEPGHAIADPNAPAQEEDLLAQANNIVVYGARIPTPIEQIERSVTVVSKDDIQRRQQRFLIDALRNVPGVQPIQSGSFGAVSSLSIRGLPSSQTLVVQDGIVLNNPSAFGNAFNFGNFSTNDIQQIEVLRGAQSTLYGSDAIGGVINIITDDSRTGIGAYGEIEGGSFGTFRGSGTLLGGGDSFSGRLSIAGVTTQGFSSAAGENGNVEADGFHNITLSGRTRYIATERLTFEAIGRFQESTTEFDGFDFVTALPTDADNIANTQELSLTGIAHFSLLGGKLKNRLSVSFLENDAESIESDVVTFDALGERLSYEYQGTLTPNDRTTFVYGVEYEDQRSDVDIGFGGSDEIETISGYGLLNVQPLTGVSFSFGVRHDTTRGLDNVAITADTTFNGSGAVTIPVLGVTLRASYFEGFRAPSIGELSLNPNLQSEISDGFEVGISKQFLNERVSLQTTYFDQRIDNLIGFDPIFFTPVNVENFASKGIETIIALKPTSQFSLSINHTYIDAVNTATTLAAGLQPDHKVNAEIVYLPTTRLSLSTAVTYNGPEELFGTILDDFVLLTLRGRYQISDQFNLFARIENATNADYQDNPGFGTAPIAAYVGVATNF